MKKINITIIIALIFLCTLIVACEPPAYAGKNPELFKVGAHNIIGSLSRYSTDTSIVETDSYGRVLFFYYFRSNVFLDICNGFFVAACIAQKSDDEMVYFYEDICVKVFAYDSHMLLGGNVPETLQYIPEEDIEMLKEENDWERPLNDELMSSRPIDGLVYDARNKGIYGDIDARDAFLKMFPQPEERYLDFVLVGVDEDGKSVYYFRTLDVIIANGETTRIEHDSYIMLFNKDGSFDPENSVMPIDDILNCQSIIHELKVKNGWKFK